MGQKKIEIGGEVAPCQGRWKWLLKNLTERRKVYSIVYLIHVNVIERHVSCNYSICAMVSKCSVGSG